MPLDPNLFPRIGEFLDVPMMTMDIADYDGGMVNKKHAAILEANQAALLQNVEMKEGALVRKRAGTTNVLAATSPPQGRVLGLGYWNPLTASPTKRLVSCSAGNIYDWSGTGDWRQVTGGSFSGSEPVHFVTGYSLSPFTPKAWLFQRGASSVYQYDGTSVLTTVSGQASGLPNSIPLAVDAVFWLDRLWVLTTDGYVFYSDNLDPTKVDVSAGYAVNPNDPPVRLLQWFNAGLLVFQRNSISVIDVDQSNFDDLIYGADATRMETINYDIGCLAGKSVAQSGEDFFFLSRFGVMQLSKTIRDKAIGRSIPISDPIQGTIDRINWFYADKATGVVWDNVYYLAIPIDGSTTNNYVIAWDIQEQGWFEINGWSVGDFRIASFAATEDRLYFGTSSSAGDADVFEAFSTATTDDGTEIVGVVESPRYDFGTTSVRKRPRHIDLFVDSSSGGSVEVYCAPDNQSFSLVGTVVVGSQTLTLPFFLPPVGNPILPASNLQRERFTLDQFEGAHEIQFRFRLTGAGRTKLLYYSVTVQPDEPMWSE